MRTLQRLLVHLFLILAVAVVAGCGPETEETPEPESVDGVPGMRPPAKTTVEPNDESGTVVWKSGGSNMPHGGDNINPMYYNRKIDKLSACSTPGSICTDLTCSDYAELHLMGEPTTTVIKMKVVACTGASDLWCIEWWRDDDKLGKDTGPPANKLPESFKADDNEVWKLFCDGAEVFYVEIDWKGNS